MTIFRHIWAPAIACGVFLPCLAGCSESDDPVSEQKISIGLLVELEDTAAAQSETAKLLVALREINGAGGITLADGDYTLELVTEDHGGDPAKTSEAIARFAEAGVTAVVGPPWSSLTLGEQPDHSDGAVAAAMDHGVLLVSGSATAQAISDLDDDDLMWRTAPSDSFQALLGAQHLFLEEGISKTAVIYRDDAWGTGLATAFEQAYEAEGGRWWPASHTTATRTPRPRTSRPS